MNGQVTTDFAQQPDRLWLILAKPRQLQTIQYLFYLVIASLKLSRTGIFF